MPILLRQARIIDPKSKFHQKTCDIRVENGVITAIGDKLDSSGGDQEIQADGLCVSPGWLDMRARFGEPGFEYKEDLRSGAQVAASGGFTAVALLPDTEPVAQTKADIEFIANKSRTLGVDVLPYGALTQDLAGEEITEMFDMQNSGAVAFSNAGNSVKSGTMQRALLYAKGIDGLIQVLAQEGSLVRGGQMHEGYYSTLLGLKGIPAHAESIAIHRDIELLRYTGGKLHFNLISTAEGLDLIRQAKKDGLAVSCDVAAYQLLLDDSIMEDYNTLYKVFPPLRDKNHVEAMKAAVLDGTIDAVVSNHHPEDPEHKDVEFDYAAFGMSAMQQTYNILLLAMGDQLSDERLVELLSLNPRALLNQNLDSIAEGAEANLTMFSRSMKTQFSSGINKSKARNNPFLNAEMPGKCIGIITKGQAQINA
ncbi:MAG: dihydroorotase [Bacteroidetes bacterium]|nr:MAG: dihydroorotase [Bacteroidota bacterium]